MPDLCINNENGINGNSSQFGQATVFAFQNPNILRSNPSQDSLLVTLHY